jgi:hypothetical protein
LGHAIEPKPLPPLAVEAAPLGIIRDVLDRTEMLVSSHSVTAGTLALRHRHALALEHPEAVGGPDGQLV